MDCPDEDELRRWLAGGLEAPRAAAVWGHVSSCRACASELASLTETQDASGLGLTAPRFPTVARLNRGATVGRYLILDQVGRGAMGVVYAAYDPQLNRRVALKFLLGGLDPEARARLLREAQAMAAVHHPNVISVHDVGTFEDQVFVVMEFVEGVRLGEWVRQSGRTWKEIVPRFVQAGQALQAVHRQGLVHRDFKPDNVLVAADGRVGVTDFGLARRDQAPPVPLLGEQPPEDTRLTQSGALVGTPVYMSPEQLRGAEADARSDQFAFCVALYEALYGQRPFPDSDYRTLRSAVLEGRLSEPPAGTRVPRPLRRVVLRGLSTDPQARYPSMGALLEELGRDPHQKWKLLGAAAVAALVTTGVVLGGALLSARRDQRCQGAEALWAGVWDPAARGQLQQAFAATGRPSAALTFQRVASALDGFTADWNTQREQACRATHLEGAQSEAVMDLRMACLDHALQRVSELTRRLQRADGEALDAIVLSLPELPALQGCADAERLMRRAQDARTPEERQQQAQVRAALARAQPALMAGRPQDAAAPLKEALEVLETLRSPALVAETRYLQGRLQVMQKDAAAAEGSLRRAAISAAAAREDALEALAWIELVHVVGARLERYDEAHTLAQVAQAAIRRVEVDADLLQARLESATAGVLVRQGKNAEALERFQGALALQRRLHGENDPMIARLLSAQGAVLRRMARLPEAERAHREAVSIAERLLGEHPTTAGVLTNLAPVLRAQGNLEEAQSCLERAHAIYERTTGPDPGTLTNLAVVIWHRGELEQALALTRRAYELEVSVSDVASTAFQLRLNIGLLYLALERPGEGLPWLQESLRLAQARFPPNHPIPLNFLAGLSEAHRRAGNLAEAERTGEKALALTRAHLGSEASEHRYAVLALGKTWLMMGKTARALPLLESMVGPQARLRDPEDADAREWLARGLIAARKDPARARLLLEQAEAHFQQAGPYGQQRLRPLRAFRREAGLE